MYTRKKIMKKKIKANLCALMGSVCLALAGAEADSFVIQVIVAITAAFLFAWFFRLAARLLADDKETELEVYQMRPEHEDGKHAPQGLENHRFYIPM